MMLILSDIHGGMAPLAKALSWYRTLQCRHIMVLGDLLNHGPRNPLPVGYDPAAVADTLNGFADRIMAIRGNCDSEVDQMLCRFPMSTDYNWLVSDGRRLCFAHGHRLHPGNLPPLAPGEGFVFGHTHLPVAEWRDNILLFNPGSISIPKGGHAASFGCFDGKRFTVRHLENGTELFGVDWICRERPGEGRAGN